MKSIKLGLLLAFTLLLSFHIGRAAPVISSFSQNGELVCSNLSVGSRATIEWASSVTGPWTNSWAGLESVEADLDGVIRVSVPMFYRVRVTETNSVYQPEHIDIGGFQIYQHLFGPDAVAGIFEVINATGNLDLYVRHSSPPTLFRYDYLSATFASNELITVGTNFSLYPVSITTPNPNRRWYLGVTNLDVVPANYCVRVTEVLSSDLFRLTVGVPEYPRVESNVTYYVANLTANNCNTTTFTIYNQLADLNFYVAYGRLPTVLDNDGSAFAFAGGESPGSPANISITPARVGDWFIAVVNTNSAPSTYGILVSQSSCFAAPPFIKASSPTDSTNVLLIK